LSYRPTIFYAGPALYAALLQHKEIAPSLCPARLRLWVSAGDAVPANLRPAN